MADVDPEVERLAQLIANADASINGVITEDATVFESDRDAAAAVLADLRERYVLVPREDWEAVRAFGTTVASVVRANWETLARRSGLLDATSAPLSAQNGPDDSQGHPDRDDA